MIRKIPLSEDHSKNLLCTTCALPMQYQTKIENKFLWQCFKCGKKYFISESINSCSIEETPSPPK